MSDSDNNLSKNFFLYVIFTLYRLILQYGAYGENLIFVFFFSFSFTFLYKVIFVVKIFIFIKKNLF